MSSGSDLDDGRKGSGKTRSPPKKRYVAMQDDNSDWSDHDDEPKAAESGKANKTTHGEADDANLSSDKESDKNDSVTPKDDDAAEQERNKKLLFGDDSDSEEG
jgi:hypothetical protein